jgi:ribosomal protein S18 acetylase RimI-like enzyme|tara:strand:+ start:1371 stop:1865 length:495 start_codon:yes stop_codon:yes gene_type:complete
MIIREIQIKDAKQFLELTKITDAETPYLYFEENERKTTHKEQIENIKDGIKKGYISLVAEEDKKLVAYALGFTFEVNRRKHCMSIAIAVLQEFSRKGLGTQLLSELIEKGKAKGITRFELDVSVNNPIAINLYKKMGFVIEGERQQSYLIDGEFDNDYIMAKII